MPNDTVNIRPIIASGFHPDTKQLVITINVEDVQEALASKDSLTVTEERALQLMKEYAEALERAYQYGWNGEWARSIRDVLGNWITEKDRSACTACVLDSSYDHASNCSRRGNKP